MLQVGVEQVPRVGREELATLGRENAVIVWDSETGRELARMHHNEGVADMAFSPDGKYVATAVKG